MINNNCGYDGDLELALIPESFRTDVLKETLDSKGVRIENSEVELAAFALLFEFNGDQKHIRHVLYNCSASRPGIEGKTNEDSKEVQTEKLSLKAVPLANGMVNAKTGNTTDATTYAVRISMCWEKLSETGMRVPPISICSPLRCLRTSPTSWQSMQIPPSRTAQRNGLMSSAPSPSTRCFRKSSNFGA